MCHEPLGRNVVSVERRPSARGLLAPGALCVHDVGVDQVNGKTARVAVPDIVEHHLCKTSHRVLAALHEFTGIVVVARAVLHVDVR